MLGVIEQPTLGYSYRSRVLPGISHNTHRRGYGKAVGAATTENHPENHSSVVSGERKPSATPFIIAMRTAHLRTLRRGDRLLWFKVVGRYSNDMLLGNRRAASNG